MKEIALDFPEIRILSLKTRLLFGLMTRWRKLVRKRPQPIGELLLRATLELLATGYKTYKKQ